MKNYICALFVFIFLSSQLYCQKINKYYSALNQETYILYYIYPLKVFVSEEDKSDFIFDITSLTSSDSAAINFTYFRNKVASSDSISFITDQKKITLPTTKIYLEVQKKNIWSHRFTCKTEFNQLIPLFSSTTPSIEIFSGDQVFKYQANIRKWKKDAPIVKSILQMINENKK